MRNNRDRNIIKCLFVFILYYGISYYFPSITNNRVLNLFIKDLVLLLAFIIIYFKDLMVDYNRFKKSKDKWKIFLWIILIYIVIIVANNIASKYFGSMQNINENDKNNLAIKNLYMLSKPYALFKTVIFTAVAEIILYSYSIRKIINNNIIFIIISALIYTYFNYLFTGFSTSLLIGALVNRFIPYCMYNLSYVKNKNIFFLVSISAFINLVAFIIMAVG